MVHILAAGIVLLGSNSKGQQTPAAKPPAAPAAKTRRAAPAAKTPTPLALTTQKDKFSYALGMNLGMSLKKQSVEVDPVILSQGLKAALAGGKALLSPEEAQATLMEVQNDLRKKQQEKMQVAGEANKKDGAAFLASNQAGYLTG